MDLYYAISRKAPQAKTYVTPTGAYVDADAFGVPFASVAADEENISSKATYANVGPNGLPWISVFIGEQPIDNTPSYANVSSPGLPFAVESADTYNISQKWIPAQVFATGIDWSSDSLGTSTISPTTSSVDAYPVGIPFAVESADVENISQKWLAADVYATGISWISEGTNQSAISNANPYVNAYAAGIQWTSVSAGDQQLVNTPSIVDVYPVGLLWESGVAGEYTISAATPYVDVSSSGISWSSGSAGIFNIGQNSPHVEVSSSGLQWSSSEAATHGLAHTPAYANSSAVGLPWVSVVIGSTDLLNNVAYVDVYSVGLPFTTESGVTESAVCLAGTTSPPNPMYGSTGMFSIVYNELSTFGYVSVWYKYPGADAFLDLQFDNVIFTLWGEDEKDRLEFGLQRGFNNPDDADAYVKLVDSAGGIGKLSFESPEGRLIMDGQWHNLIYGSRGEPNGYYFFLDAVQVTDTYDEYGNGVPLGQWWTEVQDLVDPVDHELTVGATRFSGSVTGDLFLTGCVDELMVVDARDVFGSHSSDPAYLYNNGNGRLIPQVESDGFIEWSKVYTAWEFLATNRGYEYKQVNSGAFNLDVWVGQVGGDDGIPGA